MIPICVLAAATPRAAQPSVEDPHWEDVVLLINGVGAIYDATGRHTVTNPATAKAVISDSDLDFPLGGVLFPPNSHLFIADSSDFDFPGDFTIEFDHKPLSRPVARSAMLHTYNSYGANGGMGFFDVHNGAGSNTVAAISGTFNNLTTPRQAIGVKRRYRYVRAGSTLSLYIDDVFITSQTRSGTLNAVGGIWVATAGDATGVDYSNGIMGRIRITRVARTEPQGTSPFPVG